MRLLLSAIGSAVVLIGGTASAHISLTSPAPRTADQKAGPCGVSGSVRGSNVTSFAPGETITVTWKETVEHPGHYRISIDMDGNEFTNPNNPNDAFPETMVEPIADRVVNSSNNTYSQEVTLPMQTCENCTLQLVQVMTTSVPYNSFYFQCADIRIGEGGDPVDPPPPEDGVDSGCSTGGGAGLAMLGVVLAFARRRRA
jgi:MYXO-CTERM domain-containing protein